MKRCALLVAVLLVGGLFGSFATNAFLQGRAEPAPPIPKELTSYRDIVKKVKDSKLKVQASIQGDFVRVAGKDRDTLQQAIALLRGHDFGIDVQFINYRSN